METGRSSGCSSSCATPTRRGKGIAAALGLAEHLAAGGPILVVLGDNIYEDPIEEAVSRFRADLVRAMILLNEVDDPERFGVARLQGDRVGGIVERLLVPPTRYAVTGCSVYDAGVFDIVRTLEPSARGELEITDVNNRYIQARTMRRHSVRRWWTDAGTVASLHRAIDLVARGRGNPVPSQPRGWR